MHYIQALPTIGAVLALCYMGFIVIRNSQEAANRSFGLFLLADSTWLITVALVVASPLGFTSATLSRLAFALAIALVISIQGFASAVLRQRSHWSYGAFVYGGGTVVFILTLFTPAVISGVTSKNGLPRPLHGALYEMYVAYLVITALVIVFMLLRRWIKIKKTKDAIAKRQLDAVVGGILGFGVLSFATNFILPAVLSSSLSSQFAPTGSLILAFSFFIAISRYRLFDIRNTVVRSTVYITLVAILAFTFVLTANLVGSKVATFQDNRNLQQLFNAFLALMIAISFQPLKRLFDRLTNKYFFRDIYDTQDAVDRLNNILISNVDMHHMLRLCETLIVDTLKLEFCFIGVFTDQSKERIISSQRAMSIEEYDNLRDRLFVLPDKIVSLHNLPSQEKALRNFYEDRNISAIGKMTSHEDLIGFIVLGGKKNGAPLTAQDMGVLSIASDQIAIAAQNVLRFAEIIKFNETLKQKVEEATGKLRRSNDKLRAMDETKDDFISMASHQLRTPLTSIKGYVSMVLDGDMGEINPAQRHALNQALVSSQRMVFLIADLLNLSRLKTGKFVIEATPTKLADIIESEVKQLQETAKARELELIYHKPAHFPALMLDETKIRQVAMNFMDNSIYYTHAGGHIAVELKETEKTIEFTVTDDGIGVPKHEQPHLFNKFYRAGNARKARPDGTGLGLFMAKKVIVAQGGSLIFHSKEGKGSTFGFSFAKAKLLAPADANPVVHESNALAVAEKSLNL